MIISIVIPVYNAEKTLENCIKSVLLQDFSKEYEIIIIDNNSTDKSIEIAKRYPVKIIKEKKQGPAAARNRGLKIAKGKYVAFLDADCVASNKWLENLYNSFISNSNISCVGGKLEPAKPNNLIEEYSAFRKILSQERVFKNTPYSPPFLLSANMMIKREIGLKLNGFDENLFIGEDADFCWRIVKSGGKLYYAKKAIAYHYHRSNLKSFLKQTFSYGYGHTLLLKKYSKEFNKSIFIDIKPYLSIPYAAVKFPFTLITGKSKIEKLYPIFDIISSTSFILGKLYGSWKNQVFVF